MKGERPILDFKTASLIPKQLFEGEDMFSKIGEPIIPIIIALSRRIQYTRRVATMSFELMFKDCAMATYDTRVKAKFFDAMLQMQDEGWIDFDNDSKIKVKDAFEVGIHYELNPYVLLYEQEILTLQYYPHLNVPKLLMIYLYIVKHINEKTKKPTWVSPENIGEYFGLSTSRIHEYISMLKDDVGILAKIGKRRTQNGFVSLHTRNNSEYIQQHRTLPTTDKVGDLKQYAFSSYYGF